MSERPYSRVYWSVKDDERFVGIYGDDRHFATWVRLLMAADAVWPHPADMPATARKASIAALCDAGIIEMVGVGLYRVHGLDRERERRQSVARASASARWSDRSANASATAMRTHSDGNASQAETSQAKPSRDEPTPALAPDGGTDDTDDAAVALHERTGTFPTPRVLTWLNEIAEQHGEARTAATIRRTPLGSRKLPDYLRAVVDALRLEDHAAERAEREAEKVRNAEKRNPTVLRRTPDPEISDEEADRIAREYRAKFGRQEVPA